MDLVVFHAIGRVLEEARIVIDLVDRPVAAAMEFSDAGAESARVILVEFAGHPNRGQIRPIGCENTSDRSGA